MCNSVVMGTVSKRRKLTSEGDSVSTEGREGKGIHSANKEEELGSEARGTVGEVYRG